MLAIAFDFETTGLLLHPDAKLAKQPSAIEFGCVLIDASGEIFQHESLLINPGQRLDPIITKITGLTDADLEDKPRFGDHLPRLRELFAEADIMVAHNLPFDAGILECGLARVGATDFPWPKHKLCTAQAYAEEWGRRPRLQELYEAIIGRPIVQTHRALDDARMLAEILIKEGLLYDFYSAA